MAIFYLKSIADKEKSLSYCKETLRAALPFFEYLPAAQNYIRTAIQIVQYWGEDAEAFLNEVVTETGIDEFGRE